MEQINLAHRNPRKHTESKTNVKRTYINHEELGSDNIFLIQFLQNIKITSR